MGACEECLKKESWGQWVLDQIDFPQRRASENSVFLLNQRGKPMLTLLEQLFKTRIRLTCAQLYMPGEQGSSRL